MGTFKYVISSIRHYRRTHAGILAGAVLAALVVSTSLQVGSSVRGTLLDLARSKLQRVRLAAVTGEAMFRAELADRMRDGQSDTLSAALVLRGTAVGTDNRRLNSVQVCGVDDYFFQLGTEGKRVSSPGAFACYINAAVAERLGVNVDDELLLRMEKPTVVPGDAPFSSRDSRGLALRLTVIKILSAGAMGDFSLRNDTARPFNIFVNRQWLSDKLEKPGYANMLLAAMPTTRRDHLQQHISDVLYLEDVGLKIRKLADAQVELVADSVFIPEHIGARLVGKDVHPVFTYFANSLSAHGRAAPYFFVSGDNALVPAGSKATDLVITQWLADDLGLRPGDSAAMTYFTLNSGGGLKEESRTFTVHSVIPTVDRRDLMPAFPGMADADSCSDWDPGLPINLDTIRQKDEDYWDAYKGSPKAFVSLETAQKLWGNRFGSLTAIRFSGTESELRKRVAAVIRPADFGLSVTPIYQDRMIAGSSGVDFGGLFVGLSFFIIIAALVLTSLLFSFGLEQRRDEIATLLSLGFTRSRISRLFILEGVLLSLIGGVVGAGLAIPLNRVVIGRISTVWSGTVSSMTISEHLSITNLAIGCLAGVILAVATVALAARHVTRGDIRLVSNSFRPSPLTGYAVMTVLFGAVVVAIFVKFDPGSGKDVAMHFMGAGFCALLSLLGLYGVLLGLLSRLRAEGFGYLSLLVRALAARRGRNLGVVGTMSIGLFLIAGVAANRHDPLKSPKAPDSGTGGYMYYAEASVPLMEDLNTPEGRKVFDLPDTFQCLQMKHRPGADASCLNLAKVMDPGILALDPLTLAERNAFSFASSMDSEGSPWVLLNKEFEDGAIPVIADNNVILWSLGKGIGDDLVVKNDKGQAITLRFVAGLKNSIFQGWVIMSQTHFSENFPSRSGSTVFLIDGEESDISSLRSMFRDSGMEITSTHQRLARFNRVESTYLEIFLALGGLGLLIGTVGLAIVVSRNILERRQELGIMQACGFTRGQLRGLVAFEHLVLFVDGLIIGALAAFIAIFPALSSGSGDIPLGELALQFCLILLMGCLCIVLGCRLAMGGKLHAVLRNE